MSCLSKQWQSLDWHGGIYGIKYLYYLTFIKLWVKVTLFIKPPNRKHISANDDFCTNLTESTFATKLLGPDWSQTALMAPLSLCAIFVAVHFVLTIVSLSNHVNLTGKVCCCLLIIKIRFISNQYILNADLIDIIQCSN